MEVWDMDAPRAGLTVRQAVFIGVGAMVGAGIFSLLGPAGEVAGAAVWVSFVIAGSIALLQGYSFAKLGSRYPSGSGLIEYLTRGFGPGHLTGISSWLVFASNIIVTSMVAVSFGSYASSMFTDGDATWAKIFAASIILAMGALNVIGSSAVAKAQGLIVRVVIGILVFFSIVLLADVDWSLLASSGYPSAREIVSSVALTFFAFLGFGVITFTAKDLAHPKRELPRAMYIALGIAAIVYIGISLGVYGTLTVDEVIASGGTALAEAAKPALGEAGYWLMAVTALFATAGATNSGIYPTSGLSKDLADKGQFPPVLGRDLGRVSIALGFMVVATLLLTVFFDLSAIASLGSAVALLIFTLVSIGHLRVRRETGARIGVVLLAVVTTATVFAVFTSTTLAEEPATMATLVGVIVLSIVLDLTWKSIAHRREGGGHVEIPDAEAERRHAVGATPGA
jgi:amino acid transporter